MTAVCTKCGHETERVLQAQFPHICLRCLFPQSSVYGLSREVQVHRSGRWVP